MFADPRVYPPKPCEFCGVQMACVAKPYEMSNWSRKRYCSRRCRDKARHEAERRNATAKAVQKAKASLPEDPLAPHEKAKKTVAGPARESALDYTPEGASKPLRAMLIDTFRLHPDLGVILMNPGSTWGKIEMAHLRTKAT
jgi:hypothetical protein